MSDAAEQEYARQQQRLREQNGVADSDGAEDDEEALFEAEHAALPEINPEVYKDVDPLLFRGFVTATATINGVQVVFKSLNHHEYNLLAMMHDIQEVSAQALTQYYCSFLAFSVVMFGGVNILRRREDRMFELNDFFQSLDIPSRQKVIRHLSEVNRRANRAVILVEPYVMEARSRMRWAQLKGLDMSSPSNTGIEGTQNLGLNWGQLIWKALNYYEDLKENAEREWENSKFIASAMAGKGMSKVYNADRRRRISEREEKVSRRERVIKHALLNEPLEGKSTGSYVMAPRTVQDLTEQLQKDLSGEKDWHDKVIDDYQNRIAADMRQRAEAVQHARAQHLSKWGNRAVRSGTDMRGLTETDLREHHARRQVEIARGLEAAAEHPELVDPKFAEVVSKWIPQPTVGAPTTVVPVPPVVRPVGKPFGRNS